MFGFGKGKKKRRQEMFDEDELEEYEPNTKSSRDESGRKVFGFPCSPDISARIKMLAGQLQVPVYARTEHALQLSAELIAGMAGNLEQYQLLRQHLLEHHVAQRTIEKSDRYDREMADILQKEWQQRSLIDSAVRRVIVKYARRIKPEDIEYFLDGFSNRGVCFIVVYSPNFFLWIKT